MNGDTIESNSTAEPATHWDRLRDQTDEGVHAA
jgi:hypothetical protein